MATVKQSGFKWDARFTKEVRARIERFDLNVGIIEDGPHRNPLTKKEIEGKNLSAIKRAAKADKATPAKFHAIGNYAGGPVRKAGRKIGGTLSEVSKSVREKLGINFYTAPFRKPSLKSVELQRFLKAFVAYVRDDKSGVRRIENTMQAVVRNPILRGEYGSNSTAAANTKGFDRLLIDTGQLFKAIIARATKR